MDDRRPPSPSAPDSVAHDEVSLADLSAVLKREWRLVSGIIVFSTAAATASTFLMTPIYRAETLLSPVSEEKESGMSALAGQLGGLAALVGMQIGGGGNKEEAIATLKARVFTEEFIRDENLLPIVYQEEWDAEQERWKEGDPKKHPTLWRAAERFDKTIREVSVDKKTGLVTLAIEWKDPKLAADWANKLVRRANAQLRERVISESKKSLEYLNGELEKSNVIEIRQATFNLIEAQTKKIMVANVREDYAFRVVDAAVAPEKRVRPKRALIVVLGVMVGAMLGALAAFKHSAASGRRESPR